jgi:preprotein translocase subunit YajC
MNHVTELPLLMGVPGAASGGSPTSMAPTLVTFGLVFLIFYFLIIRPQQKRQRDTKKMLEALKKGDRIVTIGGIRGTITSVKTDVVVVKVDDNTKVQFSRSAISQIIDPSTAKSAPTKEPEETDDTDE